MTSKLLQEVFSVTSTVENGKRYASSIEVQPLYHRYISSDGSQPKVDRRIFYKMNRNDMPKLFKVSEPKQAPYTTKLRENAYSIWRVLLKEILSAPKYSESIVARKLGITRETVYRLMNGMTTKPRARTISRLLSLHLEARPDLYSRH